MTRFIGLHLFRGLVVGLGLLGMLATTPTTPPSTPGASGATLIVNDVTVTNNDGDSNNICKNESDALAIKIKWRVEGSAQSCVKLTISIDGNTTTVPDDLETCGAGNRNGHRDLDLTSLFGNNMANGTYFVGVRLTSAGQQDQIVNKAFNVVATCP